MKRIIIFFLALLPFIAEAQNDTTKYYKSNDYGWTYQRLKTLKALIPPTDTTTNKLGLAVIGWNVYVGNGTSWSTVVGGGGGSFYDSVLMASTQRLKDTAAVLRAYGESLAATKINSSRTLTINGVSYDLSSNRSWTVGTVTQSQLDDTAASIRAAIGGGGGTPGGSTTQVQFNNAGSFSGDSKFVWNNTSKTLTVDSLIINGVNINKVLRGLSGYSRFTGTDSIVIMAGAAVPTVNGDNTITWVTLFPGTGHNTYYVDTVRASSTTGFLHVKFPKVARIVTWVATIDDALANKGVFVGGSITLDSAILNITKICQLGGYAYGNGTSYTTSFTGLKNGGSGASFTFSYDNGTGTHTFSDIPVVAKNDPYAFAVGLATPDNWRVVWDWSGLSNYQMKFKIYDNVSNTVITGAPTTNHKWFLSGPVGICQVNAGANSAGTDMSKNTFVSGSAIIFYGIGEK